MPLIDNDEFLEMCNELDRLKENEKDLKKGYIDLKLENTKINNQNKKRSIIMLLLITTFLLLLAYLYNKHIKYTAFNKQKYKLENLLNNTSKEVVKEEFLTTDKVFFAVQIESLKDYNITEENAIKPGKIRKLSSDAEINSNAYVAGEFYTYNKAKTLRDKIKKIGVNDVSVIALHEGKKISLRNALKLLEN
ncbi:hypothetical protein PG911_11335 [Tenacibaculum ovolyticum]|uniref:hypothetical protein n=1 Tax=Tenacibaculum ovolyticum TaxID=104270 RepID=UPI0022F3A944|nr:hypothetical protein [Tenacibaculum ovolyticum]WBX75251.1 hypothetical protein PG911_11335 [Tenacibaculum ovolyticum]